MNGEGEIISFARTDNTLEVSTRPKIKEGEAVKTVEKFPEEIGLKKDSKLEVTENTLKFFYPNRFFEKYTWQWSDTRALTFVVYTS